MTIIYENNENNHTIFSPEIRATFFNFQKRAGETSSRQLRVCIDLMKTPKKLTLGLNG